MPERKDYCAADVVILTARGFIEIVLEYTKYLTMRRVHQTNISIISKVISHTWRRRWASNELKAFGEKLCLVQEVEQMSRECFVFALDLVYN